MLIRPEFIPPHIDQEKVQYVAEVVHQIRVGAPEDTASCVAEIRKYTDRAIPLEIFMVSPEDMSDQEIAETILRPAAPVLPDITRSEYLDLIALVRSAGYDIYDISYWCEIIEINLPHPHFNELVFDRMNEIGDAELLDILVRHNRILLLP